jgi:hypothetical protein
MIYTRLEMIEDKVGEGGMFVENSVSDRMVQDW